jgi:hypothetical protein
MKIWNTFIYVQYQHKELKKKTKCQPVLFSKKNIFYAGIKIFNSLPSSVTILKNNKAKFKAALRKFLNTHSFYSVDKCFMYKDDLQYCFVQC